MSAKFTPGPWKAVATIGGWDGVEDSNGHVVCKLVLNNPPNADLIAAVPDLYESLDETLRLLEEVTGGYENIKGRARQALAKARGESQ